MSLPGLERPRRRSARTPRYVAAHLEGRRTARPSAAKGRAHAAGRVRRSSCCSPPTVMRRIRGRARTALSRALCGVIALRSRRSAAATTAARRTSPAGDRERIAPLPDLDDGSGHCHPDHQAVLRVLRYSNQTPSCCSLRRRHQRRGATRGDVLRAGFQDYLTGFRTTRRRLIVSTAGRVP